MIADWNLATLYLSAAGQERAGIYSFDFFDVLSDVGARSGWRYIAAWWIRQGH